MTDILLIVVVGTVLLGLDPRERGFPPRGDQGQSGRTPRWPM